MPRLCGWNRPAPLRVEAGVKPSFRRFVACAVALTLLAARFDVYELPGRRERRAGHRDRARPRTHDVPRQQGDRRLAVLRYDRDYRWFVQRRYAERDHAILLRDARAVYRY